MGPDSPATVQRLANSYRCPVGPYAGRAYCLLVKEHLDDIKSATSHDLEFKASSGTSVKIKTLYLIDARHVTAGDPGNANGLWLARLADPRIHAEMFSDTEDEIHRTRGAAIAYSSPYLPSGSTTTWQQLVDALWPSFLGTAPTLPYSPAGNPEGTHWHGQPAWWALHAVLDTIGCTTAYDPLADSFSIVRRGDTQTLPVINSSDNLLIFDAAPVDGSAAKPGTIACYFSDWFEGYGLEDDSTNDSNNWLLQPPYDRKTATGAGTIGVLPIWSDLPRVLDNDGTDQNASDRTARMSQYATNVNQDLNTDSVHKSYEGVIDGIVPGSEVKEVLWRHWGVGHGMVTEYVCHPGDPQRTPARGGLSLPIDPWRPPDLARRSYPNYPRVCQTVRAYDSGESLGAALDLETGNYTEGEVVRHKEGASGPFTREKVWLRAIDEWDVLKGDIQLVNGDHFVGRLCGIATVSGASPATRPLYAVRSGAGGGGGFIGVTQTTITAMAAGCPGSGTLRLYEMNASNCLVAKSGPIDVTVWNMCAEIPSGVYAQGKWIGGYRFIDVVCCP